MVDDRPVVSVVCVWSGAKTWTTRHLAGYTSMLGWAVD